MQETLPITLRRRGEKIGSLAFWVKDSRDSPLTQRWVVYTHQDGVEVFDSGSETCAIRKVLTREAVEKLLGSSRSWLRMDIDTASHVFVQRFDLENILRHLSQK